MLAQNLIKEPLCDIIRCLSCGWQGSVEEGIYVREGDWESGYYDDRACPNCEDSEIEYDMSEKQAELWCKWNEERNMK